MFKTTTYREKYVSSPGLLLQCSTNEHSLQLLAESFRTVEEKMPRLKKFVTENPGATIIYVTTHKV